MKYGWSPEQMARVNARREASGRKTLDPGKIEPEYGQRYSDEYEKRSKRKRVKDESPEENMTPLQKYLMDIQLRKNMRSQMQMPKGTLS